MEENPEIALLAECLRSPERKHNDIFSISAALLSCLNQSLEQCDEVQSFHITPPSDLKKEALRDLYYLHNYIQNAKYTKIYSDKAVETETVDIIRFKNLIGIEFNRVNINLVVGLQKLRSRLQKLKCHRTLNTLSEVLVSCGADQSHRYFWNELKELVFTSNQLQELDLSLECAPWLHTLDLSHNELEKIDFLSCLVNLKRLNLSFNKLEKLPQLKGQICSRLQDLILRNNFIEDLAGLQSLQNVWVLDLSNNCLIDHKVLMSVSHLATLQLLNLSGNPLSYHPHHRIKSCSYLHINTASAHIILDNSAVSKAEKKVIGTLYPMQSRIAPVMTDSMSSSVEKTRKVRYVTIEDDSNKPTPSPILPPTPQHHLQTKKQIESLREQYGDNWLYHDSGVLVQNVLGLEGAAFPVSSSPYEADFLLHSADFRLDVSDVHQEVEKPPPEITLETEESYATALDIEATSNLDEGDSGAESELSEGDLDLDGDEGMYLATPYGENEEIFLVVTKKRFSERECASGKERARWHINSIVSCTVVESNPSMVKVCFDTMRRDRKRRIYNFEDDLKAFLDCMKEKIEARQPLNNNKINYQCMKCNTRFDKVKEHGLHRQSDEKNCPNCDSNIVVECS